MDSATILAMWKAQQERFHNMVKELPKEALSLAIGPATIGYMIRHSAEVECVYAEWVFGKQKPQGLEYCTLRGPGHANAAFEDLDHLVQLLQDSHEVIVDAIQSLPDEEWTQEVKTPRGTFTRLDAIVQLMYHTGIHAGQISLIQKHA